MIIRKEVVDARICCCFPPRARSHQKVVSRKGELLTFEKIGNFCFGIFSSCTQRKDRLAERNGIHIFQKKLKEKYGNFAGAAGPRLVSVVRNEGMTRFSFKKLLASEGVLTVYEAMQIEHRTIEIRSLEKEYATCALQVRYYNLQLRENSSFVGSHFEPSFGLNDILHFLQEKNRGHNLHISDEEIQEIAERVLKEKSENGLLTCRPISRAILTSLLEKSPLFIRIGKNDQRDLVPLDMAKIKERISLAMPNVYLRDEELERILDLFSYHVLQAQVNSFTQTEIDHFLVRSLYQLGFVIEMPQILKDPNRKFDLNKLPLFHQIMTNLTIHELEDLEEHEIAFFIECYEKRDKYIYAVKGENDVTFTIPSAMDHPFGVEHGAGAAASAPEIDFVELQVRSEQMCLGASVISPSQMSLGLSIDAYTGQGPGPGS